MRTVLLFVIFLSSFGALALESFDDFKRSTNAAEIVERVQSKINELRNRYEIPKLQRQLKPVFKAKFDEPPNRIFDFEDRKRVVGELIGKLNKLRENQDGNTKPDREFFELIKKALIESRQTKMIAIEPIVNKTVTQRAAGDFSATILRQQSTIHQIQAAFFEEIIVSRAYMSRSIRFVHRLMMQTLGQATENIWHNSNAGTQNSTELNRCASEAYAQAIRFIQRSYYPELDYTIVELSSALNILNYDFSRTNLARDQRSLLALLDNDIQWMLLRGNNRETVLIWEVTNYIDNMQAVSRQLRQCLQVWL